MYCIVDTLDRTDCMKIVCLKIITQTYNGSAWICYLLDLMPIICNLSIGLLFGLFRPVSLGISLEKNSGTSAILTPPTNTSPNLLYAVTRPKPKATAVFTPKQWHSKEVALRRCLYNVLGNTCYPGATTKVGQKWGSAPTIERTGQDIILHETQEAFLNWWPGVCFLKHSWCPTSQETYTGTKDENHCWWLPHHYK